MGIKNLLASLKKDHPGTRIEGVHLGIFKGLRVAIDLSIYAYVYMAVSRKEAMKYIDPVKQVPEPVMLRSYWLERYYGFIMMFIECGIVPIPVFDGPHFRLKQDTKENRAAEKEKRAQKIIDLRNQYNENPHEKVKEDLRKEMENDVTYSSDDWEALEDMLRHMGLPVIKAKYEAEAVCARLVRCGVAAATVSRDGDTLAHLSRIMIADVKREYRRGVANHKCEVIILQDVLNSLDLTAKEFVDFCIMCGTDYNNNIKLIGFKKSLELIKKYGTIEKALGSLSTKDLSPYRIADPALLKEIRGYFLDELELDLDYMPHVVYNGGLQEFMEDTMTGYNKARIMGGIAKTIETLKDFNQVFAEMQKFILVEVK